MDICRIIDDAFLLLNSDDSYLCGKKLKELVFKDIEEAHKFCELYILKCIANQEYANEFLNDFGVVHYPKGFDVNACVTSVFRENINNISSKQFAFRIMDWLGAMRSTEVADFFEDIYTNHQGSALYECLGAGFATYIVYEYSWEAEAGDKIRMQNLWEQYKKHKRRL